MQDAARYLQIYDVGTGRLVEQSEALAPLGVGFAPGEIRAFVANPADFDLRTADARSGSRTVCRRRGRPTSCRWAYRSTPGTPRSGICSRLFSWSLPAGLVVRRGRRTMDGGPRAHADCASGRASRGTSASRTCIDGCPCAVAATSSTSSPSEFNGLLARLERAVDDMRQFSAAMAHEIRTPLAALRAELETSLSGCARRRRSRSTGWRASLKEVDKLTRLLGQLLTLARAEAGELSVAREPVALEHWPNRSSTHSKPWRSRRTSRCRASSRMRSTSSAIRGWLERLLSTSWTTRSGSRRPAAGHGGGVSRVGRPRAILAVRDTGAGIPSDVLPSIFDRFWVGPIRTSGHDGAGLGLSLVKWIVEQHAATIQVESRVGGGSLFTVRFPVKGATGWA